MDGFGCVAASLVACVFLLTKFIKVLPEYERGVVFRLGRVIATKGPGLILLIPFVDTLTRISLRLIVLDVEKQDVITKDNVSVAVNAVVYFRVVDPQRAVLTVENYHYATGQLAQTTLRSVLGQFELDDLLSQREKINDKLQTLLDASTDPWGVKVTQVEVKHIDLPSEMQRAMARQAEAERERRAKVITATGELQASDKLAAAAAKLSESPASLQLRFLQTLSEVATEHNSTIVFPVPIDLFTPFLEAAGKASPADKGPSRDDIETALNEDDD
jgi:regulator of protease activity HflC (stomatin/prohibitin superfamily)